MSDVILYDYWRSSASYRIRIALNLAGVSYETRVVNLLEKGHKAPEHLERNPQGLVPVLKIDGFVLSQSLAILDYLEDTGRLQILPKAPVERAQVRAAAQTLAVDVHPVCNLSVVTHVAALTGDPGARDAWMARFIRPGLEAFEARLSGDGPFCFGATPGLADICLVPQLYNADRYGVSYADLPRLSAAARACAGLDAFQAATPEAVQPV